MNALQKLTSASVLPLILLISGCESGVPNVDYSGLGLVNVSGRITLDGKPLVGGVVQFVADDGTFSSGRTDDSGHYLLQFNSEQEGVLPGRKTVRIVAAGSAGDSDDSSDGSSEVEGGGQSAQPGITVPPCYHSESQLQVEVTSAATRFDFELKSDCSTTGPKS